VEPRAAEHTTRHNELMGGVSVWHPAECRGRRPVTGPLRPYAVGFQEFLTARGYSPSAVRLRLWLFDHVSRWLAVEQLIPGELTRERAEEFIAARRASGYRSWVSPRSMALPMEYLRGIGVAPPVGAQA